MTDPNTAAALEVIQSRIALTHVDAAIVMGSGWACLAEALGRAVGSIPIAELPGFLPPVAEGHLPEVRHILTPSGRSILAFLGRTHLYEGHGPEATVRPVALAAAFGAQRIVLTNASGGVNPGLAIGDAVLLTDHLNLTGLTPLVGATFVDLTGCYSDSLREAARAAIPGLAEGIYAMLPGPQYETPAENRFLRSSGADIVGMSTVLEAIMARSLNMAVCAISVVSAPAPGSPHPITHDDVLAVVGQRAVALAPAILAAIDA